jgi:hypothetical protein
MGKESTTTAVEADHAKLATQLKAEHAKEDAALKAEETQKMAALKAEHAKQGAQTGFLGKLTGSQDPMQKAETENLKAEIDRAEAQTKAAHTAEKAELDAARRKELAAAEASDKLRANALRDNNAGTFNNTGTYNNAAPGMTGGALGNAASGMTGGALGNAAPGMTGGVLGNAASGMTGGALGNAAHGTFNDSYAPSNYNAAPGHHNNPNDFNTNARSSGAPLTDTDKKIYNHATGSYGQAAIDDGRRQQAEINPNRQSQQTAQQFAAPAVAAIPIVLAPVATPQTTGAPMMGTNQHL